MGNIFNGDFQEFIQCLNNNDVKYILVGGYSVILHGYSRTTGDLDVWVDTTIDNYRKLKKASQEFGLMTIDLTEENFMHNDAIDVFTFGRPPVSIDIMKKVKGLSFEETYSQAIDIEIDELTIKVIHKNHLILAKESANRPEDQNDIIHLKAGK